MDDYIGAPLGGYVSAGSGMPRRTVVKAAAWSAPVIAAAIATPLAAASEVRNDLDLRWNFGVGWYPTTANQTDAGALQIDAKAGAGFGGGKYLRVDATRATDQISNIYVDIDVYSEWGALTFTPIAGSNSAWMIPVSIGSGVSPEGRNYTTYRTSYGGTVQGVAGSTYIPIEFYFRASTPFRKDPATGTGYKVGVNASVTVNSQVLAWVDEFFTGVSNIAQTSYPTPTN